MPLGVMRPLPFDMQLAADKFERIADYDEATLTQDVVARATQLTPSEGEKGMVEALQKKIKELLEKFITTPDSVSGVKIEEVHEVGSLKKDVVLSGHKVGDLAVVLSTLPTFELVAALGHKITDDLRNAGEAVSFVSHDFGGEIKGSTVSVRLLITTLPKNAALLEPDLHLSEKLMMINHLSIRQAEWFTRVSEGSPHKLLVRVLKDIRNRHSGLQPMSSWVVEYLANFCISNTINHLPLPLGPAFRRFFEILSAGFLLPGLKNFDNTWKILKPDVTYDTFFVRIEFSIKGGGTQEVDPQYSG
ncbi:hypothetical protein WR25_07014 [Diploscapter pachys]|uniref:DZF domain-containing protein n=1 Tax=Diploscapter pachys TaxID=2018661 RepID=A0A2A2JRW3_9BILA|nr:hypothetical protein WR25_07014 [Diploscapter pachys]